MKKILPLLFVIVLLLTGCQEQNSLQKKQMQTYINQKAGYVILLPQEWKKSYENDVSTAFIGQNPNISMDIVFEIGGFDYFSLDSLSNVVINNYKKTIKVTKVIERGTSSANDNAYRIILEGKTPQGKDIIVKTIFFEPDIGIRYYLAFAANPKDYYANDYLFEDIAQSFQMTKTSQDLYKLLKNREQEEFKKEHAKDMKKYKNELKKQKQKIDKSN